MRTGSASPYSARTTIEHLHAIVAAPADHKNAPSRGTAIAFSSGESQDDSFAIMGATGKSKPCVWRWQERFMSEGVDGLLRDKSRPPGIAPLDGELVERVVAADA